MNNALLVNANVSASFSSRKNALRIAAHIAFWLFFTILFFTSPPKRLDAAMMLSWLSILTIVVAVVYINLYLLFPLFFFKKKYLYYFLILPILLVLGSKLISALTYLNFMAIDFAFFDNLKNLFFFVLITSGLRFFRENERKKSILQQYEKNQLEMELALLKSQVNPHFLFNTLNNLYATNLDNPTKANEMILQLSDILRFQIDVTRDNLITLTEEIQLIENYINLEKIRLYEGDVKIVKIGDFSGYNFPPLLLLPLVENALKYGRKSFLFTLKMENGTFTFESVNEIQRAKNGSNRKGIGLQNVRKRIELIYPNRFHFDTSIIDNNFYVTLKIDL